MSIGICYSDRYSVEELFQLLKVPWAWYEPGSHYDVVIAFRQDVHRYTGPLIDLTEIDFFQKISDLLNNGQDHLHQPTCDLLVDQLRHELKKYTLLAEIPPSPWGHPYMLALTHDVDITSARECRYGTVGYAAYQCFLQGDVIAGINLILSKIGRGADPWVLFDRWKEFERSLGVRSTFFFVPHKDDPGIRSHPYRAVPYDPDITILNDLARDGWEIGVHGIDNWTDAEAGSRERTSLGGIATGGNRTHWLLFDENSWSALDAAGYSYDSTCGYNDDAGFRAGTLQAFRPRGVQSLLELPLHIQDISLFGRSCWAPAPSGWKKIPCLHLDMHSAFTRCAEIFDLAKRYGGAVTLLWHYENITSPRNWSGIYRMLIERARKDGAWLAPAGNCVAWFRLRRQMRISLARQGDVLVVEVGPLTKKVAGPDFTLRLFIPPEQIQSVDAEFSTGRDYIDVRLSRPRVTVNLV